MQAALTSRAAVRLTRGAKPGRISPAPHGPYVAGGVHLQHEQHSQLSVSSGQHHSATSAASASSYRHIEEVSLLRVQCAVWGHEQHLMQRRLRSVAPVRPLCGVVLSKDAEGADALRQQ